MLLTYVAALQGPYLDAYNDVRASAIPCVSEADLTACRSVDAGLVKDLDRLSASLDAARPPATLSTAQSDLARAVHDFDAAIQQRIAFIDEENRKAFLAADTSVLAAAGELCSPIAAIKALDLLADLPPMLSSCSG